MVSITVFTSSLVLPPLGVIRFYKKGEIFLNDSILVALITFAAGVTGASIGALATYQTAKQSLRNELKKLQHGEKMEHYLSLMKAYNLFSSRFTSSETGFGTELSRDEESELYSQLLYAGMAVDLVGSGPVIIALKNLNDAVNQYARNRIQPENINEVFSNLVDEMRKDIDLLR